MGWLKLLGTEKGISNVTFVPSPCNPQKHRLSTVMARVVHELDAYFSGERIRFFTPLDLSTSLAFFRSVWRALQNIPYGQTISYSGLASIIGRPNAARAVGMAAGKNPIPIIIPCHRVIRSDGSLGGYGPGIELKRSLLNLENALHGTADRTVYRKRNP